MKIQIKQNQLKSERLKTKYSIRKFSDFTGMSGTAIQALENGKNFRSNTLDLYLFGLSQLNNCSYLFLYETKKTTQKV